jgi:hypothetical protein
VTWPSPPNATCPFLRTPSIVVERTRSRSEFMASN